MAPDTPAHGIGVAEPPSLSVARGSSRWLVRRLRIALVVFSLVTALGGFAYYRWDAARIQAGKSDDIAAIAEAKTTLITRWRQERMFDARRLAGSPSITEALAGRKAGIRAEAPLRRAVDGLRAERDTGGYTDASLLGVSGDLLLSARSAPGPMDAELKAAVERARQTDSPVLSEPYKALDGTVRIDSVQCVRNSASAPMGFVALSSDAADFLFPSVQAWPTPSESAEALLSRRDGNEVVYLSELRFEKGPPLSIRRSLSDTQLPAVKAAMGVSGEFLGYDYRGHHVLSDLRAVPGTSWYMQTKVDTDELLAEVRYRAMAVAVAVLGLIVIGSVVSAYLYRTQQSAERAAAMDTIGRSEALLMEAQRVASLGHYELDVNTGNWTSSAALDGVFGIDPTYRHDVTGWVGLVHPDDRDEMASYFQNFVVAGGHSFDKEYRIVRVHGGEVRWVHGLGDLVRDDMGRVTHMFGTIQDITSRKALEEDLRQRNHDMARFVYTVSHDLKSPLVTIQTFLGFLDEDRKQNDGGRIQKDIDFIRKAAERMSALLNDLLELSRVGRVSNSPVDVPLRDLVTDALEMVAGRIAQRGVTVTVTEAPAILHGDRARLMEVFENLIDNAVKFMGDQPNPRIEIGVERSDAQTVYFVRDNGIGIDPRHVSKLFGLFEKLHPDSEGTGIGLALIKRILEVHGGRIWVHSDGPGLGTTFRFTIPGPIRPTEGEPS